MTFVPNNTSTNAHSILVIGATGKSGQAIMQHLAQHRNKPRVHAFCRSPAKLVDTQSETGGRTYHSVVMGNARDSIDLTRALDDTKADICIVCVGNGDNVKKNDIRTANAKALVQVLKNEPRFRHVRVIVLSSTGASDSEIIVGLGFGKLISYHLRHILTDHTGQEAAFNKMKDRVLVVRPTALTDDKPNPKIIEFGNHDKSVTIHTDRDDVARYIVEKVYAMGGDFGGQVVNITGAN